MGSPSFHIDDFRYGLLFQAVSGGDISLSHARQAESPDFLNLLVADFSLKVLELRATVDHVDKIIHATDPLQIGENIISGRRIDMIDLGKIVRIRDKCQSNETMDVNSFLYTTTATKADLHSTGVGKFSAQDHARIELKALTFSWPKTSDASYTPKVADFVNEIEWADSDRTPFFDDRHTIALSSHVSKNYSTCVAHKEGGTSCP